MQYYKNLAKCKKCNREYGYDNVHDDGFCPACGDRGKCIKRILENQESKEKN